ncbi:hypothetical protein [Bradyrhizobium sp. 145]|uniref:hypothetical protein n=1 Tax=Bradyrhizobium sp. 145 TaxID=2782621 RepID=UPI001FFBB1F2|nr:hypothetical protein [Bradyrhizobium sp. 145]MCK1689263.1 hypothetical protein [Bradyrhizobium sp. 145]
MASTTCSFGKAIGFLRCTRQLFCTGRIRTSCGYRTGLHRNRFPVRRSGKLARSMKPSAPLQGRLGELQRETSAKLIDIASLIGVVGSSKLLGKLFLSSKPAPEM